MISQLLNQNFAKITIINAKFLRSQTPKIALWGAPAAVLGTFARRKRFLIMIKDALKMLILSGGWMIWPALTPSFKKSIGFA